MEKSKTPMVNFVMDALIQLAELSEKTNAFAFEKLSCVMSEEHGTESLAQDHNNFPPLFAEMMRNIVAIRENVERINEYIRRTEL